MPIYQIVKSDFAMDIDIIYKDLSKRVSSLLLDGWKCQGGVCIIMQSDIVTHAIQAMIYDC